MPTTKRQPVACWTHIAAHPFVEAPRWIVFSVNLQQQHKGNYLKAFISPQP